MQEILAWDTETHLIRHKYLNPDVVCISYATDDQAGLSSTADDDFEDIVDIVFDESEDYIRVAHNLAYDLAVMLRHNKDLDQIIFRLFDRGLLHDTMVREKLLNLTTEGIIDSSETDEYDKKGKKKFIKLEYTLEALAKKYLGIDMSDTKKGEAAWRLRYAELEGIPSARWPKEAVDYAVDDSRLLIEVYKAQEERREFIQDTQGFDPFAVQDFRTKAAFCFWLISINGVHVNAEAVEKARIEVDAELVPEKLNLLFDNNILNPAEPESIRYTKAGAPMISHVEGCERKKDKVSKEWLCDCPPKTKKAVKEKLNTGIFKDYIFNLWKEKPHVFTLHFSDSAKDDEEFRAYSKEWYAGRDSNEEFAEYLKDHTKYISTAKEFLIDNAHLDPVLEQFQHRQSLQKLKTTEIPRMCFEDGTVADVVHPGYDILKRTGRTSSYAGKLYPSLNFQNIHAKFRNAITSPEGYWLLSIDYKALEFISGAQTCLNLFGKSKYAEVINSGRDAHAYLAAPMAYELNTTFKAKADELGIVGDSDAMHDLFVTYKKDKMEIIVEGEKKDFYKHFRTFAKPCGLGYFGGLGPKTLTQIAWTVYGFKMSLKEAEFARDVWRATFPYAAQYLKHVAKNIPDKAHSTRGDKRMVYTTPMGLRRPNCTFTAAANGNALQSPSAEGAIEAQCRVVKESRLGDSILNGNIIPCGFIHDEICVYVKADTEIANACSERIIKIMCESLQEVCPDVTPDADPALMITFDKRAEDVYNDKGQLIVWSAEA